VADTEPTPREAWPTGASLDLACHFESTNAVPVAAALPLVLLESMYQKCACLFDMISSKNFLIGIYDRIDAVIEHVSSRSEIAGCGDVFSGPDGADQVRVKALARIRIHDGFELIAH
jgi:hypothetical protein